MRENAIVTATAATTPDGKRVGDRLGPAGHTHLVWRERPLDREHERSDDDTGDRHRHYVLPGVVTPTFSRRVVRDYFQHCSEISV
jgi:hypothetical protein